MTIRDFGESALIYTVALLAASYFDAETPTCVFIGWIAGIIWMSWRTRARKLGGRGA